jgi:NTE family protein
LRDPDRPAADRLCLRAGASPPSGVVARGLHAVTLLIAGQLIHDLERLSPEIDAHMAPSLCPLSVSPFDFSHSDELIERAAERTRDWIEKGGLSRRASPRELAPHHHRH